jgi:type I restriction enzyme S subunit
MAKKNKNPAIRFKGFTEDWEEKVLGDFGKVAMNKRIFKYQTSEVEEIPFFKIGSFGSIPDAFISRKLFEEYKNKYPYPKCGDILISASGSIGRIVEYLGKDEYFQDSNIVWLDHNGTISNQFLKQYYSIIKWNSLEGGTIKRLYNKSILSTKISTPSPTEQKKIGAFFQNLDKLITVHQKKYDKLVILKKAMLEKMFPKNGDVVPEIRFKGFTEDWKRKELKKIASNISDGNWIESNHIFEEGEYRIIQTGNLGLGRFLDKSNHAKYFHQKDFDEVRGNEIFPDDILISRLAEPAGRTIILPSTGYRMVTAVDVTIIRPDDNSFDAYFLMTQLNTTNILKVINENVSGTSHKRISRKKLEKTKLIFPTAEEQQKIGEYFKDLDNQVSLHKTQLDKLNNIKNACFSKIFVSQE